MIIQRGRYFEDKNIDFVTNSIKITAEEMFPLTFS